MKVTGETITDEQIKELWSAAVPVLTGVDLVDALGMDGTYRRKPTAEETRAARQRCADAWNARHGGAP